MEGLPEGGVRQVEVREGNKGGGVELAGGHIEQPVVQSQIYRTYSINRCISYSMAFINGEKAWV